MCFIPYNLVKSLKGFSDTPLRILLLSRSTVPMLNHIIVENYLIF